MTILVVGISVRAAVESAVGSGYPVIALDAFGDRDLGALAESYSLQRDFHVPYSPSVLFESSRKLSFESVAYTSNLENYPEILDCFSADHAIIGNPPEVVRAVRDWRGLFSRLADSGLPVPETIFPRNGFQLDRTRGWLIKPVLSGGGHGISFLQEQTAPAARTMVQQFIPGKACSASFVANGRESVLIGVTGQLTGLGQFGVRNFRYCGSILPLPDALQESGKAVIEQARQTAAFLTREFGLTGVNGFDFILNQDRVWLIEVNPRYSASMELIERAYGLPIFNLHVEAVTEGRLPGFVLESELIRGAFFGKSILFCERDCIAPAMPDYPSEDLRDIPIKGEKLHKGSPVCTLLTARHTYEDTLAELTRQAEKVKELIYA